MGIKKNLVSILITLLLVILTYYKLPDTFFQQDQWSAFGKMISLSASLRSLILGRIFLSTGGAVHFAPLTAFFSTIEYLLFGISFSPYAIVSVIIHVVNSFMVFYLACLLFRKQNLAFYSAVLFAVNGFSHQAVSWISATINTQGACLFVLLSLIFLIKYRPWWSVLAFLLALGFKETSAFLFIFLPLSYFIFFRGRQDFSLKKILLPLSLLASIYFVFRLWLLLSAQTSLADSAGLTQPHVFVYFPRLLISPVRIIPQSFLPASQIIAWSRGLVSRVYPHYLVSKGIPNPFVVESVAFDFVCMLLLLVFFLLAIRFFKSSKVFWLAVGLITFSGLPLVFIPGRAGYVSMIEPRHLYLAGIGSSLILAMLLARLKNRFLVLLALLIITSSHYRIIQRDLDSLLANSRLRESILTQIRSEHPSLPEKVIFYTESDTAYYGLGDEEKILPFQSGLGQTLLVWYYETEKFPPCLYEDVFLYKIESQGYRECQGRGFGYFRKYDDLLMAYRQNHLPAENVVAYRFNSWDNSLTDISQEVWQELKAAPFAAAL